MLEFPAYRSFFCLSNRIHRLGSVVSRFYCQVDSLKTYFFLPFSKWTLLVPKKWRFLQLVFRKENFLKGYKRNFFWVVGLDWLEGERGFD